MKNNVLDSIIKIPVNKPTPLYQCGTWSTVYPAMYTYKRRNNEHRHRNHLKRGITQYT